jgi:hypothetical protein
MYLSVSIYDIKFGLTHYFSVSSGEKMPSNASEGSRTHESEEGHTSLTPRHTRSHVWEHFEKDLVDVDGELKAICK